MIDAKLSKHVIELPIDIKEDFIYIYGPRKFFDHSSSVILYEDDKKFVIPNVTLKDIFAGDVKINYLSDYQKQNTKSNVGSYIFNFKPLKWQKKAVEKISANKYPKGLIKAPTGSGKSILAILLANTLNKSALIVVDRQVLIDQWDQKIKEAFDSPTVIKINSKNVDKISTDDVYDFGIVTVQFLLSLMKENYNFYVDLFNKLNFDMVIYDEAHTTASADAFGKSVALFKNYSYIFGLTATPYRESVVAKYSLGKVIVDANDLGYENELADNLDIKVAKTNIPSLRVKVWKNIKRESLFANYLTAYESNSELREKLVKLIISETKKAKELNGKLLVVVGRLATIDYLEEELKKHGIEVSILTSKRKELSGNTKRVIIGTYGTVSKGFDCPELSILITTVPVHGKISVVQLLGRLVRKVKGKNRAVAMFVIDKKFEELFEIPEFAALLNFKYFQFK